MPRPDKILRDPFLDSFLSLLRYYLISFYTAKKRRLSRTRNTNSVKNQSNFVKLCYLSIYQRFAHFVHLDETKKPPAGKVPTGGKQPKENK
jgi:hypothetical protein